MKRIFLIVLQGIICQMANAQQENNNYRPLAIGELMPDITIQNVDNYTKSELKFSELRGKIVILDFWMSGCVGCILQFPKLEALQKKFGDQLRILLVNRESKQQIEKKFLFMSSIDPRYKNAVMRLVSISGDSTLHKIFPHRLIPHEVWIDSNGKVMAITDQRSLTEKNVQNVLDGYYDLPEKKDIMSYSPDKQLLPQIYDSNKNRVQFYSCLIKGVSGLFPSHNFAIDSTAGTIVVTRTTKSILKLYAEALSKGACFNDPYRDTYFDHGKRIILEIGDSSRYFYDSCIRYDKWFEKNCYAYEMVLPLELSNKRYDHMLSDLNKFFSINGRVEKKRMKCFVIVRTSNSEKFRFKGPVDYDGPRHWPDSNNVFHFRSTSFKVFRMKLSEYNRNQPLPFVDDTGYTGLIQMDLESPLDDIAMLRMELKRKYDLDIVEKTIDVDVMRLSENGYKK